MCHEYTGRAWDRIEEREDADEEADETPEFLNEEGGDVEVLTDGGDES